MTSKAVSRPDRGATASRGLRYLPSRSTNCSCVERTISRSASSDEGRTVPLYPSVSFSPSRNCWDSSPPSERKSRLVASLHHRCVSVGPADDAPGRNALKRDAISTRYRVTRACNIRARIESIDIIRHFHRKNRYYPILALKAPPRYTYPRRNIYREKYASDNCLRIINRGVVALREEIIVTAGSDATGGFVIICRRFYVAPVARAYRTGT